MCHLRCFRCSWASITVCIALPLISTPPQSASTTSFQLALLSWDWLHLFLSWTIFTLCPWSLQPEYYFKNANLVLLYDPLPSIPCHTLQGLPFAYRGKYLNQTCIQWWIFKILPFICLNNPPQSPSAYLPFTFPTLAIFPYLQCLEYPWLVPLSLHTLCPLLEYSFLLPCSWERQFRLVYKLSLILCVLIAWWIHWPFEYIFHLAFILAFHLDCKHLKNIEHI